MFFLIDFNLNLPFAFEGVSLLEEADVFRAEQNWLYIRPGRQRLETLELARGRLMLLGDPVFRSKDAPVAALTDAMGELREEALYEEVTGHYYWFLIQEEQLKCGSSFGGIFPVYHHVRAERAVISSSSLFLARYIGARERDRRNLLERLLFNYPFFSSTWWAEIRRLDTHRHLRIRSGQALVAGEMDISRYFGDGARYLPSDMDRLTQLFSEEARLMFPDEPFAISLTGGFDGRTVVAAARQAGRGFLTYSFGRPGISDLTLPASLAKKLRMPFLGIGLDGRYLREEALPSALAFMRLTEYNGNFGRPHYEYAARVLAGQVRYILTGNFGSELFRAMHEPGVMISAPLIRIFSATDSSWKDGLRSEISEWKGAAFGAELDELIADLEQYLGNEKGLDLNHRFYRFVYNEVFRKYFGPELVMQSHYLSNRTPYLSLRFTKELNGTIWSGVHSRIFEKMLNRRMKGQMFYASFLRQADSRLYRYPTNKGYRPDEVLESWRLPVLAAKAVIKKYIRRPEEDNNAVTDFFRLYHGRIAARPAGAESESFLEARFRQSTPEIDRGEQLEDWIKFYSIAAGWTAAAEATSALFLAE